MATNLILNPSFTQGVTNWTLTDCTSASTTTEYLFNNIAREITASSATTAPTIVSSLVTITASTTYTASIYVKLGADQASTSFSFSLLTYQSDGTTLVDTFTSDTKELTVSSGWYRFTVTGTSGAGAVKAKISLTTTAIVNGRKFVIDGGQLVTGYNAVEFDYIETVDQAQENKIINKALSKVPFPHLTGVELNADIKLGDFTFNTIDANNVAYIITGITGLYGQPETEYSDISRGFYADGDYDVRGRYQARQISITGSILVQDKTAVASAKEKLIRATELVKRGTWLKVYPPNSTPQAIWVRLSGALQIDVINPRGRMDFSIGLRAPDPLIYAWNEDREDGYYVANVQASNYEGTQIGEVSITNNGNYQAPAIYEVRGPITGSTATLFNYSNNGLTRIIEPIRGERYYLIGQKSLSNYEATLKFPTPHDLIPGDSVTVSIPISTAIANVQFTASTDTVVFTVASTAGYSIGDIVAISSLPATNTINSYNGTWTIATVPNTTAFTITDTAGASDIADTATGGNGTAYNITNSRFNGEQVISSIPDGKSISFSTTYRETYSLRNLLGADVANSRCVVYKDADYLEIDTKDQNVALNGDGSQYRGKLDALSDWIHLEPGVNKILLDDAQQVPYYVENRTLSSGVATLQFTEPHTFAVGDNINVVDVGANYDTAGRATITSYSRAGNVVTAVASGYGMTTGTSVVIGGIDFAIDGQYSITNVNASAFTFVTNSSGTIYSTNASATVKKVVAVSTFSRTSNVVTLTTSTAHGLTAGQAMYVAGVHPEFDGQWYVATAADSTTLTYDTDIKFTENFPVTTAPSGATAYLRFPIIAYTDYSVTYNTGGSATETSTQFGLVSSVDYQRFASINTVSRNNNIATLTTTKRHNYQPGEYVSVEGPSSLHSTYQVSTGDAKAITSWTLASNLVTVTTTTSHGLVTNDKVNVYGVRTGSFIDINGQYVITNTGASTFTYNISGPIVLTYGVNKYSIANNIVRLELNAKPEFDLTYDSLNNGYPINTQIDFASSGTATAIVGRYDVIGKNTESNTIWFATTAADVALTTLTNTTNTIAIVYDYTPERGRVQRVIEAVYFTINNQTGGTESSGATASPNGGPLKNSPAAGNTVWVKTNTAHGLSTGNTVEVSGLSSLFNGVQTVTSVDSNMFRFTIDNTTLVEHKEATITRAGNVATVTFTVGHEYVVGDKIWLYSPHANITSGIFEVVTSSTSQVFQILTGAQTGTIATGNRSGYKVLPYRSEGEVLRVYPILEDPAPTDFTFSYNDTGSNEGSTAIVAASTAGEVVSSSDASMKVYYRSASIG
jgi:hypothetical protein